MTHISATQSPNVINNQFLVLKVELEKKKSNEDVGNQAIFLFNYVFH